MTKVVSFVLKMLTINILFVVYRPKLGAARSTCIVLSTSDAAEAIKASIFHYALCETPRRPIIDRYLELVLFTSRQANSSVTFLQRLGMKLRRFRRLKLRYGFPFQAQAIKSWFTLITGVLNPTGRLPLHVQI